MKQGYLVSWRTGCGYGLVAASQNEIYFLHRKNIAEGNWVNPEVGSRVEFEVIPAITGGRFAQAIKARITTAQAEEVEPKAGA